MEAPALMNAHVQLKKAYTALGEALDLTRELAGAVDRDDQITVRMLVSMRQEPTDKLAKAQEALAQAGIKLYGGVTGAADEAVRQFLAGGLSYQADVRCEHHEHHGQGHCGEDKQGCSGNGGGCGG